MKRYFLTQLVRITRSKDGKLRTKLSVFLICLMFSAILWGMIKLTHIYEVRVNFSIAASAVPKGKILTSNADSLIAITVKATGVDFYLRLLKAQSKPILLDLRGLNLRRSGDQYYGYLRTSRNLNSISSQLPSGTEIISIEPDTLHFVFEKSYSKVVPVKPEITLKFSRQYQLYDSIKISPDSVRISGRKEIADTVRFIPTEQKTYSGLKAELTDKLALQSLSVNPPLTYSMDSVSIKLNVEKFTEARIEVPVKMKSGKFKESSFRTFPEKVEITCLIAMKDYNRLDPSLFNLEADPDSGNQSAGNRIQVKVTDFPSFVKVIKVEPDMVEYLIIR